MNVRSLGLWGVLALAGCGDDTAAAPEGCDALVEASGEDQTRVQTALIDARAGDVLCFQGAFSFTDELSLTADGVTLRGYGDDEVVFDFAGQESGANGLHVDSVAGITIEDITVQDTKGDGIRFTACQDVVVRRTKVVWTAAEPSDANGAYGLYPVTSQRVLIEDCEVEGSSDAGFYVGQSEDIIVRRNKAYRNVAGIEIENSKRAEVYENEVYDNTGGILVFDLPGLPAGAGGNVLAHHNDVHDNNRPNFASEGTIVSFVPPGAGFTLLAMDNVELRDNEVRNQDTTGVLVVSYVVVSALGAGSANDPDYDQFPEGIYIHDNTFEGVGSDPATVLNALDLDPMPEVVWDGILDTAKEPTEDLAICVADATFVNADFRGGFMNPSMDLEGHECTHDAIGTVDLSDLEAD